MTVLVVEDDTVVSRLVSGELERRGMTVLVAGTVAAAREALRRQGPFQVVLLDVTLPDGTGLEVLRDIRQSGSIAHVIMLSGAATEADRVRALALGADDYVVKPFFVKELTARILAVRRRRGPPTDPKLRIANLEIDVAAREVLVSGQPLELTSKEFDLLAFLTARPGHVFSRDDLLRAVWRSGAEWQLPATVTEHVRRLRTKIEQDPRHPKLLRTVRGVGYRFVAEDSSAAGPAAPPQPATFIHVDGCILSADEPAGALVGRTPEQLVGRHLTEITSPAWVKAASERGRMAKARKSVRAQLSCLRHADGSDILVEVESEPTIWEDGPARRIVYTPVEDASARFRQLVTGVATEVSDAVVVTDMNLYIRSWNRAAERLYGWTEHEVVGRHIHDILQTADDGDHAETRKSLEETGRWHGKWYDATRDGNEVHVCGSITLARDESGVPIGIVSVIRAVSADDDQDQASPHDGDEMRRGMQNGEFEVHYQPVVSLDDATVVTFESLLRWRHPTSGLLNPHDFIRTAVRSGVILELGDFVFETACLQGAAWTRMGLDVSIGVNLSARELADPRLVDRIMGTLASTTMDPHRLWFEVTETSLVQDVGRARELLHRLADLGIRISIDDFGTGWASLTYLKEFPVHALKIDGSFVESVDRNPNDAAIVRSILSLGTELDLVVVAESVETPAQEQALRALGCRYGQGFLYGAPTPADAVPVNRAARAARPGTTARNGHGRQALTRSTSGTTIGRGGDDHPGLEASPVVASTLRALLRVRSPKAAAGLVQAAARRLGATVVAATEAGSGALPIDLALGEGPPVFAVVDPLLSAGTDVEALLRDLVADARHMIDLLQRGEGFEETFNDRLTGLANSKVLERVLARADDGVLVMIDLDHLERIYEGLGRAAGDAVVSRFGRTLASEVRATDTTCRVGGEEFVVVTPRTDIPTARTLVDRIRSVWAHEAPQPVTFSAGLAPISESGGTAALLGAHRALSRARELGRDRTELELPALGSG
jgi:diguanylate cyclase (GGDEF)-like protein/PAS domain S-box-containing protein